MKKIFKRIHVIFLYCFSCISIIAEPPKLTVIIVVDQMAHHYIELAKPFLKRGLKRLIQDGRFYNHVIMPNGLPATGPGHTLLNTGAFAKDHGIIANKFVVDGVKVACDDDNATTILGNPQGQGKSPQHIMVNGISESFVRTSSPIEPHYVFSISGKSRAAICTANKLGKAIWFDEDTGLFTSSSFYFNELPDWIQRFNRKNKIYNLKGVKWKSAYPSNHRAYQMTYQPGYRYTFAQEELINKNHVFGPESTLRKSDDYKSMFSPLQLTPMMNQYIFDLALQCIKTHLSKTTKDRMILWICISALDKIGHAVGPNSKEAFDILYHLDKQLNNFMKAVHKKVDLHDTLFVLTADHGIAPIPEVAQAKGLTKAQRINEDELIKELNTLLHDHYDVDNACNALLLPNLYINENKVRGRVVDDDIKQFFLQKSFIKNIWTREELQDLPCHKGTTDAMFKNQYFPGRSGQFIIQLQPNCLLSEYSYGASHDTPYEDDIHIPLIFYQKGKYEHKWIPDNVYATQLANTITQILRIPGPDITAAPVLPHFFDPELEN